MATDVVTILCTLPADERAAALARALLEERLVACVNLLPGVRSLYRWQGAVHDDAETLALLKTTRDRVEALRARLVALHPYEVPEFLVLPVESGLEAYLLWVRAQCAAPSSG